MGYNTCMTVWNKGLKIDRKKYPNMGHFNKHSETTKLKMVLNHKGRTGIRASEETKLKMSLSQKGKPRKRGEFSSNWRGGKTKIYKQLRSTIDFKNWRKSVFDRDNYTCQKYLIKGCKLHPHHIQNFSQFPELRFSIDNGITLSEKAHYEFHSLYGHKNNTREQILEFISKK